jgi:putative autotransporter adhesin-like protein
MQRIIALSGLVASLLAAGCDDVVQGNGQRVSEDRALAGFSRVDSATSVDVEIAQGDDYAVTVSIDSNALPELETRVVGDTLEIDSDKDLEDLVTGPHVRVTLPDLRAASLSGSGQLLVAATDSSESLALLLSGSGRIAFAGAEPEITVRLSGSGEVDLTGSAGRVDLRLDGSGDIDATALSAAAGRLDLSGSGSIRARLSETAEVDLSGSGDVYIYGDAELTRSSIDGSGDLHRE